MMQKQRSIILSRHPIKIFASLTAPYPNPIIIQNVKRRSRQKPGIMQRKITTASNCAWNPLARPQLANPKPIWNSCLHVMFQMELYDLCPPNHIIRSQKKPNCKLPTLVSDSLALTPYNSASRQTSFCMDWRRGRYGFDAGYKVQGACREGSQSR